MKTTIEIPDDLFRRAKAKAALEGIPLRELIVRGLRSVMEQTVAVQVQERTHFPLISGSAAVKPLTDQQVAEALEQMAAEEIEYYASLM